MNNEYIFPKWGETNTFEKVLIVLELIIGIAYVAIFIFTKFDMPEVAHYLLGAIFLVSALVCLRTKRKLAILNIVIAVIDTVVVTGMVFIH